MLRCGPGQLLASVGTDSITVAVERLLAAERNLLLVTEEGALLRFDGPNRDPATILADGKDYDTRDGILVRIDRVQASFYHYEAGRLSRAGPPQPVASHELSVALGPRSIYLHSPANPANVLVVEQDRTGEQARSFLPVERNLLRLLVTDADAVLKDTGYVRAFSGGFVFVPLIHDPIDIVGQRGVALFLAGGVRGSMRTVSERLVRDDQECPTCTRNREVESRQEIRRLYADAVVEEEALWILRLDPPGSPGAALHHYPIKRSTDSEVRSWRLGGMESPPRAMAFWRGHIIVADDHHLHSYEVPLVGQGVPCSSLHP